LLLYYNKWWNISIVPCHLHYSVPFKKIQNVNQVFSQIHVRVAYLFFNLEACLQPLITAQDKSSCLLYIKANTIGVKKCEHTFLLWTFEMRNVIFWELLSPEFNKRSVVKSRGARRGAIFQKMSHCDYKLKGAEFWLKQ
jgi:hypothetical protein